MPKQFNIKTASLIITIVGVLMTFGIFAFNRTIQSGEQQKEVGRLRIDLDQHVADSDKRFEKLNQMAEDIATIKGYLDGTKEVKSNKSKRNGQ